MTSILSSSGGGMVSSTLAVHTNKHLAEVDGHVQVVVPGARVLLRVQQLQQQPRRGHLTGVGWGERGAYLGNTRLSLKGAEHEDDVKAMQAESSGVPLNTASVPLLTS